MATSRAEALKAARDARTSDGARTIISFLEVELETVKESLVVETGDDLLRKQGLARGLKEILDDIKRDPRAMSRHDGGYGQ